MTRFCAVVCLAITPLLFACKTRVELTLDNESKLALEPRVEVLSKAGARSQTISAGTVAPDGSAKATFKAKKGSSFRVAASLPGSFDVYKGAPTTISGTEDPLVRTIVITAEGRFIDDSESMNKLSQSFKKLGEDIGATPINMQNALDTRVGALLVAVPAANSKPPQILKVIEPNVLGVKVLQLQDVEYPRTNETEQINISGSTATKAAASLGAIAQFGVNFDSSKIYQMKWVMRGFGQVNKKEDADKTIVARFNVLPDAEKQQIRSLLSNHKDAKLYYINRMYVIERAELFTKEGQKATGTGDLSAGAVLTASGAYSFEQSIEQNKGYGPVVLNYWGDELLWAETPPNTVTSANMTILQPMINDSIRSNRKFDLLLSTGNSLPFAASLITPVGDNQP